MKATEIVLLPLSREGFQEFGRAILVTPDQQPDGQGEGWRCWYPIADVGRGTDLSIGLVQTEPRDPAVSVMERHNDRPEWITAIQAPIIQVVALSDPEAPRRPNATSARAFRIDPGQAVIVAKGIWHAAAMPFGSTPTLYSFVLGLSRRDDHPAEAGWIKFSQEETVRVKVG